MANAEDEARMLKALHRISKHKGYGAPKCRMEPTILVKVSELEQLMVRMLEAGYAIGRRALAEHEGEG